MRSILSELSSRMSDAMSKVGLSGDPLVTASQEEKFGDYQSNCALPAAKKTGKPPRDLATELIGHLDIDDLCEEPKIAGPGFINFTLKPAYLADLLGAVPSAGPDGEDRMGIEKAPHPQVVAVDLSSPNLAKEMHVGHLRSTVIGDCVSRILEFQGHTVHRENHVGDWGTQFGMLVAYLRRTHPEVVEQPDTLVIGDLETFYVAAKKLFDVDEAFKTESRETVVSLQGGDESTLRIWKAFCDESLRHCHRIFDRLGVRLVDRGESYYNKLMDEVIRRLESGTTKGGEPLVEISDGALCMFLEGFQTRDGEPLPLMIRKSDGGYNYATSDLATIIDRIENLKTTRIVYVVGIAQKQHFDMLFAAVRKAGWVGDDVELNHLGFGNMLAASGRPFKTREGGTVKLGDLLDEAVQRAREVVTSSTRTNAPSRNFSDEQIDHIAETVGLGAVKHFDLSHNYTSDYKFHLDTMLSLDGNTAPYMLYAYARIRAIGRKADLKFEDLATDAPLVLEHPSEIRLALMIARFADTLETLGRELKPNVLTDYLFDLSKAFNRFYDRKLGVRVIDASPEEVRHSRLRLCDLTARTLKIGLHLLGIETLEQM